MSRITRRSSVWRAKAAREREQWQAELKEREAKAAKEHEQWQADLKAREAKWQAEAAKEREQWQADLKARQAQREAEAKEREAKAAKEHEQWQADLKARHEQWQTELKEREAKWQAEAAKAREAEAKAREEREAEAAKAREAEAKARKEREAEAAKAREEREAKAAKEREAEAAKEREAEAKARKEREAEAKAHREQWEAEAKAHREQWEAELKARSAESEKRHAALDKALGKLGNRIGEWVQCTLIPNLPEKFQAFGYAFTQISQNTFFNAPKHDIAIEMDGFMQNGESCIAVEAKLKPSKDDIRIFIRRLEKVRRYLDLQKDRRKLYGAIAGMVVLDVALRNYVLQQGLYLVEPSGEDVILTAPPSGPTEY